MHDRASAAIDVRIPAALLPDAIRELPVPALLPVRSRRDHQPLGDPRASVRDALGARLDEDGASDLSGRRVGVGLGSRGLGAYPELVAGALDALRARGAVPVLLPAMGSHGGGTPEGQTAVLRDYGLLQDGLALDASDASREVGRLDDGTPLHASEAALALDRIVLLNRVKSHTSFRGAVESGLAKMLVIGLGKRAGATALHARGYEGFAERLMAARDRMLDVYPRPTFVAVVEDADGRPAQVEALLGREIVEREPRLLRDAKRRMARLPFAKLDLLVVERAGKDVSGLGMDPNVTGRHPVGDRTPPDPTRIALLSLTDASEGNANGMGLADVVPRSFADRIDPVATWTNVVTSTSLAAARLPVVVPTRADAVRLALATCGVAAADARIAWIEDTSHLTAYRVSPAALASLPLEGTPLDVTGPAETAPLEPA